MGVNEIGSVVLAPLHIGNINKAIIGTILHLSCLPGYTAHINKIDCSGISFIYAIHAPKVGRIFHRVARSCHTAKHKARVVGLHLGIVAAMAQLLCPACNSTHILDVDAFNEAAIAFGIGAIGHTVYNHRFSTAYNTTQVAVGDIATS